MPCIGRCIKLYIDGYTFLNFYKLSLHQTGNATTDLAVIAAEALCQVTLAAALLGASNFCHQFEQCCNNGRFIPCTISIPCKNVLSHYWTFYSALWFDAFSVQQYTVKLLLNRNEYPINIREVTHSNKQFIPSFNYVGFEFRDISATFTSDSSKHSTEDYNQMIKRLSALSAEIFVDSNGINPSDLLEEEKEILLAICGDFAESSNKKIISVTHSAAFRKVEGKGTLTHIHFDIDVSLQQPTESGTHIRMWIPLSNIDNFPLAVGDARAYYANDGVCNGEGSINDCAEDSGFKDAVWYHQPMMTPADVVFWNKQTVPHGSINLRSGRDDTERHALVFEFVARNIV